MVAENVKRGGYILLKHTDGIASQYMHLAEIAVKVGDTVVSGQRIGVVGCDISGYKLNHLHFQMREGFKSVRLPGTRINPTAFLKTCKVLPAPMEP